MCRSSGFGTNLSDMTCSFYNKRMRRNTMTRAVPYLKGTRSDMYIVTGTCRMCRPEMLFNKLLPPTKSHPVRSSSQSSLINWVVQNTIPSFYPLNQFTTYGRHLRDNLSASRTFQWPVTNLTNQLIKQPINHLINKQTKQTAIHPVKQPTNQSANLTNSPTHHLRPFTDTTLHKTWG